jgi:hypothetical protein
MTKIVNREKLYLLRYEEGKTLHEIAEIFGCSVKTAFTYLKNNNLDRPIIQHKMLKYFLSMNVGESISRQELSDRIGVTAGLIRKNEQKIIKDIHAFGVYRDTHNNYVKLVRNIIYE